MSDKLEKLILCVLRIKFVMMTEFQKLKGLEVCICAQGRHSSSYWLLPLARGRKKLLWTQPRGFLRKSNWQTPWISILRHIAWLVNQAFSETFSSQPLRGLGLPSHLQHCMFFLARIFDIPRLRSVPRITAEKFVLKMCLLFHASTFLGLHSPMIRSRLGHQISLSNLLPSTQLSGNKVQKYL